MANNELKESQRAGAELMQDREELTVQVTALEEQLEELKQTHEVLKYNYLLHCVCSRLLIVRPPGAVLA